MNGVKLNEIDGLMVKQRTSIGPMGDDERDMLVYNQSLTEQGNKEITLSREKVAKSIYYAHLAKFKTIPIWEDYNEGSPTKEIYLYMADAIISDLKNLIEVVK